MNVLGEWNDAEDVSMLTIATQCDHEADDLDALHDTGELIESFPKRCSLDMASANATYMTLAAGVFNVTRFRL